MGRPGRARVVGALAVLATGLALTAPALAGAAITQPPQPASGPGGSDYPHRGWRVHAGGSGSDAFYVFEPTRPRPARAPLAIVMHGYHERNKDLVLTRTDTHGTPPLSSRHGVCTSTPGTADAYDWSFCWKVWDALRSCAYAGRDCRYALGGTRAHRSHGRWSDGVPVARLEVRDAAPIRP